MVKQAELFTRNAPDGFLKVYEDFKKVLEAMVGEFRPTCPCNSWTECTKVGGACLDVHYKPHDPRLRAKSDILVPPSSSHLNLDVVLCYGILETGHAEMCPCAVTGKPLANITIVAVKTLDDICAVLRDHVRTYRRPLGSLNSCIQGLATI